MKRSDARFGLTGLEWQTAVGEVREAIIAAAAERRMTSYSEVASKVRCVPLDPHSALMNHLLGAVFEQEHDAARPALTALVTHKYGDLEPGAGFYEMARALGYRYRQAEQYLFWAEAVQDVFKEYGGARTGR